LVGGSSKKGQEEAIFLVFFVFLMATLGQRLLGGVALARIQTQDPLSPSEMP